MINERKHVRALIRKKVLGILTREEQTEYQLLKRAYTEEEFDEMIAETLLEMDDELPEDSLADWKPDFDTIRSIAEERRGSRKRPVWRRSGWAAVVLIPIMTLLVYWYATREQLPDFLHGPCAGLASDVEIPVTESIISLRWGDTAAMQVTGENHGEVLHNADVRVFKTEEGVLQIREVDDERRTGGSEGGIAVATGRQQQAMVELPDGTRIRLNAQSTLHFAPGKEKAEQIKVQGEAYVHRPNETNTVPLIIGTSNGFVESAHGDFALLSLNNLTRAAALDGELSLYANHRDDTVMLSCYGAQGSITTYAVAQKGVFKDSLKYEGITDTDAILVWTKAVRTYKDVSLREFVAQMSFWYGFRVKDYHCLPADRRITTTVCYRKDKEAVFAAIREAGVLLYESKGIISFCPEEAQLPKNMGTMLASWK